MILRNFAIILIKYSVFLPQLYTYVLHYVIMCYIFIEMISHRIFLKQECKCVCACVYICVCTYVHVYTVYICVYVCMSVCVCDVERRIIKASQAFGALKKPDVRDKNLTLNTRNVGYFEEAHLETEYFSS